jgi:hypothetical protein
MLGLARSLGATPVYRDGVMRGEIAVQRARLPVAA